MADKQEEYLKDLKMFCWENGFNPEPTRTERLAYFSQLVADKNKKLNLISKRDIDSIVEKHIFMDSKAPWETNPDDVIQYKEFPDEYT